MQQLQGKFFNISLCFAPEMFIKLALSWDLTCFSLFFLDIFFSFKLKILLRVFTIQYQKEFSFITSC